MADTIFDKIVRGDMDAYKVWEDDGYLAFLTPFPNTPGLTVVIPKHNAGDYVFTIADDTYVGLMQAVRTVARILEQAFDTPRVGLVFEGTGVAYVHAKLYPMIGELAGQTNVWGKHVEFHEKYSGYLTTVEGPAMDPERLREIQAKIVAAAKAYSGD